MSKILNSPTYFLTNICENNFYASQLLRFPFVLLAGTRAAFAAQRIGGLSARGWMAIHGFLAWQGVFSTGLPRPA
jgi:hypothetical protein